MQNFISTTLWHGLPAIEVLEEEKKFLIVFTNINGEFTACKLGLEESDSKELYEYALKNGVFDCLKNIKQNLSDELTVVLSLTERCNCRCRYCFLDALNIGKVMSGELLRKGIDLSCSLAKGREITLAAFGGEPTTEFSLLKEMISYSKKISENSENVFKYAITTNGVLSKEALDFLIENNFKISLSMDGIPEVQDYHRPTHGGVATSVAVEKTIRGLVGKGLDIKIRSTVTEYSLRYMEESVRYLAGLGINKIHFEPVTPGGRGQTGDSKLQPPSANDFADKLKSCIELGAELGVDIICFPYMNMLVAPIIFCDGNVNNRLVISPSGVMSTCVEVQNKDHELFDALGVGEYCPDSKTFEFGYDSRREAKRGCHTSVERERCKECALQFFCGGGCPTRNYRGTGCSTEVDNYRCEIIKRIMPYVLYRFYQSTFLNN